MAVRNLFRQARPFRILGWALFALILLALPADVLEVHQRIAGLALAVLGIFALDLLKRYVERAAGFVWSDQRVVELQRAELAVVPALLLFLQLPLALVVAVLGALVNANVALGGRRALLYAVTICALSLTLAWLLGAAPLKLNANDSLWLVSVALLLVFSVALAEIGFRLTQKLDNHRQQWQERLAVLQPFVPQGLNRGDPRQARRWITVVMVDLVEFTSRSSPMPPEVVGTVLDDLLDAVVSKANQKGGTLDKFMGDGVLLFFTAERSETGRAGAATAAVEFVIALLDELPELNARWHGFGVNEDLRIRVGIASGYCSLGQWGRRDVRAYTIIGACVGLAERLQSVSQEDSLVTCSVSARLLLEQSADNNGGGAPDFRRMPSAFEIVLAQRDLYFVSTEQSLKGFAQMRLYRLSDKVRAQHN